MLIQMGAACVITAIAYFAASSYDLGDKKFIHGYVTEKYHEKVSCEHSYSCNCRTRCSGSGKHRSCHRHCDTCYEHRYDIDWIVKSTVGKTEIDRVNRQGTKEPPRFTQAYIGEPYTTTKSFKNYVAAANQSLFYRHVEDKNRKYPKIYDYYRFDQVVVDGKIDIDVKEWNKYFAELASKTTNGSNILLILTDKSDINEYSEHIKGVWKSGKINDVVIVAQIKDMKIVALRAFSYANDKNNELLVIKLRDSLINLPLDKHVVNDVIFKLTNEHFKETRVEEFEYLKNSIQFSTGSMIFLTIVILAANIGLTVLMVKLDMDNL